MTSTTSSGNIPLRDFLSVAVLEPRGVNLTPFETFGVSLRSLNFGAGVFLGGCAHFLRVNFFLEVTGKSPVIRQNGGFHEGSRGGYWRRKRRKAWWR